MTTWRLRCTECGREWELRTGMDISKLKDGKIYHYCPYCKRNTFHIIVGRED